MSIMPLLKESTLPAHKQAESHPFQSALSSGKLPKNLYIDYLTQLFFVHGCLECLLSAHSNDPVISNVVDNYQLQESFLRKDLHFFQVDPTAAQPIPAAKTLIDQIERAAQTQPRALLGFHYVLWGSKHGGKYVAHSVREAYELGTEYGASYFDPYPGEFQTHWKAFAENMNAANFSENEKQEIVEAAKQMFLGLTNVGDALMAESAQ